MLLQLDASDHPWLAERGPRLSLLAAIDDATGTVPAALFHAEEDAAGYLGVLYQVVTMVGCLKAVYHDRHGIIVRSAGERESLAEQLAGEREPAQVGRASRELSIASIVAHSPQVKGRVERLFGLLQDRLVAKLQLAEAHGPGGLPAPLRCPLRGACHARRPGLAPPPARDRPLADLLLSLCAHCGA